jgi:hypothetical protein
MGSDFITNALASAHKTLDDVGKSSIGTKSGHTNFGPKPAGKPAAASSDYSHARAARSEGDSFMGVKADQGAELKGAEANREAAKKVLNQ